MLGVDGDARHGADLYALRLIKMPDALRALGGIDFINHLTQVDRLVRALWLAHIAVDALIGDHQRHVQS